MTDAKKPAESSDTDGSASAGETREATASSNGAETPVEQAPAEQAPAEQKPAEQKPAEQKPAEQKPAEQKPAEQKPKKDRQTGKKLIAGANALRDRIATVVWLIAVVCALFLAIGALMIALKMNQDNAIVGFVIDGAKAVDLGTFKDFTGKSAATKSALTNWGIAAVIYLVVGKILDRLIRP